MNKKKLPEVGAQNKNKIKEISFINENPLIKLNESYFVTFTKGHVIKQNNKYMKFCSHFISTDHLRMLPAAVSANMTMEWKNNSKCVNGKCL